MLQAEAMMDSLSWPFFMEAQSMIVGLAFHILAAVIWVGGMFFAYAILRPGVAQLELSIRLPLWHMVFSRFFLWVWLSIATLLASGFAMVFLGFGGFAAVGIYVRTMMAVGIVMTVIYTYLYFAPWRRFRRAVSTINWSVAEKNIRQIRLLVGINLILGLATVVIGASGRYYG
jgi:uncharacterized membrane protein